MLKPDRWAPEGSAKFAPHLARDSKSNVRDKPRLLTDFSDFDSLAEELFLVKALRAGVVQW